MDAPEIRLRESPRIEVAGRVRLQLASSALLIDAAVLDLSATGMGLATSVATPKPVAGESCAFDFALDGLRVEGRGVVVWSRRARPDRSDAPNVGVHFQRLEGTGEREVSAVVERGLSAARRPSIAMRRVFVAPERERSAAALAPASATVVSTTTVVVESSPPLPAPAQPRLPLEEPDRVRPEITPAKAKLEPAPGLDVAAPEVETADEPAAEPPGRRLIWFSVVGAAIALVAFLGLRSLFEQSDTLTAQRDGVAPGEPGSAPPVAVASGDDGAAAVDTAGSIAETVAPAEEAAEDAAGGTHPVPAAVAAPAAPPPAAMPDARDRTAAGDSTAPSRTRQVVAIESTAVDGGEVLILRADAPFRRQDIFAALIGPDPPRYLLRLSGIERPLRPPDLEVGSPLIQRVRTGLHSTPRGPELHVVVDLSTRAVDHSFDIEGEALRVRLRPRTP